MTHAFQLVQNDGEIKVHRTCHSIKGGSLEITQVNNLSIITSYNKKLLNLTFVLNLKNYYNSLLFKNKVNKNVSISVYTERATSSVLA